MSLTQPIDCCGRSSEEVLLDSGTHLTAYCPLCRRYLRHVKASEIKSGLPKADGGTRSVVGHEIRPFLGVLLHRVPSGAGHREDVAGLFYTIEEGDRVRRELWSRIPRPEEARCCFPHESLYPAIGRAA